MKRIWGKEDKTTSGERRKEKGKELEREKKRREGRRRQRSWLRTFHPLLLLTGPALLLARKVLPRPPLCYRRAGRQIERRGQANREEKNKTKGMQEQDLTTRKQTRPRTKRRKLQGETRDKARQEKGQEHGEGDRQLDDKRQGKAKCRQGRKENMRVQEMRRGDCQVHAQERNAQIQRRM